MFPLPVLTTNSIVPAATVTATTLSYPTTYLLNTCAPSIVYENRLAGPVFTTTVPVLGISTRLNSTEKSYAVDTKSYDDKKIDEFIKQRVEYQINKYNQEQEEKSKEILFEKSESKSKEEQEEKSKLVLSNKEALSCHGECFHCCKCTRREKESRELNLDEKIQRIREELNLPSEKDQDKLIKQLNEYQRRYDECLKNTLYSDITEVEGCKHHTKNSRTKYNVNYLRSRTRSKSAEGEKTRSTSGRSKSRSPSAHFRPPWIPTGSNDYSQTHWKREDLMKNQKNHIPSDSEPRNSLVFFDHPSKEQKATYVSYEPTYTYTEPKKSTIYSIDTVTPARTTIKTTVDSKNYVTTKPANSQYFCTTNYLTEHVPYTKTTTTTYKTTSSNVEPYYYQSTHYPLAKEYYYYPIARSKSSKK